LISQIVLSVRPRPCLVILYLLLNLFDLQLLVDVILRTVSLLMRRRLRLLPLRLIRLLLHLGRRRTNHGYQLRRVQITHRCGSRMAQRNV